PDIPSLTADHYGYLYFKIKFIKMIRHAFDVSYTLNGMMVSEIKDRVLVKFRDHRNLPVSPGGSYMLPESVAVTAGCRMRYRSKQLVKGFLLCFPFSRHDTRIHRIRPFHQFCLAIQKCIHRIR